MKKASLQKLLKLVIQEGFIKPMTRLLLTLLVSFVPICNIRNCLDRVLKEGAGYQQASEPDWRASARDAF